jgi:hypothetical protein
MCAYRNTDERVPISTEERRQALDAPGVNLSEVVVDTRASRRGGARFHESICHLSGPDKKWYVRACASWRDTLDCFSHSSCHASPTTHHVTTLRDRVSSARQAQTQDKDGAIPPRHATR